MLRPVSVLKNTSKCVSITIVIIKKKQNKLCEAILQGKNPARIKTVSEDGVVLLYKVLLINHPLQSIYDNYWLVW